MTSFQTVSRALAIAVVAGGAGLSAAETKPITTGTLLNDLLDLKGMAEFPSPAYTCRQFSSYDQRSKTPDTSEDSWFANGDRGQYLRVEDRDGRQERVMMDVDGPGAIVRIWSANPDGTIRIYLDNGPTPVVEVLMQDLLGGKVAGIPSPIAAEASKGWNCYLPMPYAKHCKVTVEGDDKLKRLYYHVNYRTYAEGTAVTTFSKGDVGSLGAAIQDAAKRLRSPRSGGGPPADRVKVPYEVNISPDGEAALPPVAGARAICGFLANLTAEDRAQALRNVIVRMTFDEMQTVESPLGDFFGSAPGVNPYESLPLGVTGEGDLWCHWYMPFKKSAKIVLVNMGRQAVTVKGGVSTVPYEWTGRTMYFHAGWRSGLGVPTRPMQDWGYLHAEGKGVFAGVAFNIANPVKEWWGEGDEKIYVDGEKFPSHFGTGTEDYFGYAWCCPALFTHAYHNQPRCDGPRNYGHTSVNRWHIVDRIPFTEKFHFDMEIWHSNQACKVDLAVTSYWYARPGGTGGFRPIRKEDLKLTLLPKYDMESNKGVVEAETLGVLEKSGEAAPKASAECSGGRFLAWQGGAKGDKLVLSLPVEKAGTYIVRSRPLRSPDYGTVQVSIDGEKGGNPTDLAGPKVEQPRDEMDLGYFTLEAGEHRLAMEITGKVNKSKGTNVGLDYVRLVPIK